MLGILAQESNEEQASPHAIIGQTGNFKSVIRLVRRQRRPQLRRLEFDRL
jgi:hypothetical protein